MVWAFLVAVAAQAGGAGHAREEGGVGVKAGGGADRATVEGNRFGLQRLGRPGPQGKPGGLNVTVYRRVGHVQAAGNLADWPAQAV